MVGPVGGLVRGSTSYGSHAALYERFALAQDAPGAVAAFLAPRVRGRRVADVGCGTGRLAARLAPLARSYTGVDEMAGVLALARGHAGPQGASFVRARARRLPLRAACVDVVLSTWVWSTMGSNAERSRTLREARRVLDPGGEVLLCENERAGDFDRILNGSAPRRESYAPWLLEQGFSLEAHLETAFEFEDLASAREVFGRIWGAEVAARVTSPRPTQHLRIFRRPVGTG